MVQAAGLDHNGVASRPITLPRRPWFMTDADLPSGTVAESTAGATLLLFVGFVSGPVTFGLVIAAGLGQALAFALIGAITALALWPLYRERGKAIPGA